MPVIINEIQITAFVSEQSNPVNVQASQSANAGAGLSEQDKEQTIKTCVEEVLRIIKEKQER